MQQGFVRITGGDSNESQKIPSRSWGGLRRYFNVLFFLDKSNDSDYYAGTNYANDNIANNAYGSKAN